MALRTVDAAPSEPTTYFAVISLSPSFVSQVTVAESPFSLTDLKVWSQRTLVLGYCAICFKITSATLCCPQMTGGWPPAGLLNPEILLLSFVIQRISTS